MYYFVIMYATLNILPPHFNQMIQLGRSNLYPKGKTTKKVKLLVFNTH